MQNFVSILNTIEENLTEEIDVRVLAKDACMSVYEFRRIFSFVIGVPISEYIRKRRLSTAAEDILANGISVTEAAMKYQYDDSSSFSRAFKEFHGVAPSEIVKKKVSLKMYTKVDFSLQIQGGNHVDDRIYQQDGYYIEGIKGVSKLEEKECCERVWSTFENSPYYSAIVQGQEHVYASYENGKEGVLCTIGRKTDRPSGALDYTEVPSSTWVAFTLRGTEDEFVNEYYANVISKWLKSSMFSRDDALPNVEVFPVDMSQEGFAWEIHIPVRAKQA